MTHDVLTANLMLTVFFSIRNIHSKIFTFAKNQKICSIFFEKVKLILNIQQNLKANKKGKTVK